MNKRDTRDFIHEDPVILAKFSFFHGFKVNFRIMSVRPKLQFFMYDFISPTSLLICI